MEPLRIGIAGAGAIAQRNAREAATSGAAKIVGVFDVNQKVARDMASALKAPFFSTYEDLLRSQEVEAVLLSTPHHLHRPQTVQAANAGKHVLVEKPMANNLEEAEEMIRACRENGVKLTVNYSFRYLPKIRKAKELIDAGLLGTITGIQIISHQFKDPGYWTGARSNSPDNWRASREKCGGGYLIMNVCHIIDYIYFLTGLKASRIYSEYGTLGSPAEVEDIISISYRLDNGAIGSISASSIMRGTEQSEERIWGTNGSLILNGEGISFYSTRPIDGKRPGQLYTLKKFPEFSWTAEWVRQFAAAVRKADGQPEVSSREGWENLAFIRSAYASLERGAPLEIPKFETVR
ncbi:Gfo/Idh/MocA family oxidoreductase [Steroidobacter sp. S1-65]|uniref:Gfo/Idh/MocA family oxidoreductase n=1 Tax=Steroidobacter gossypii TaxID=2805490 RepID=A0ABS1WZ27_9GAMM|nr:Gfo/Idh/MocA family oxidoreductase [Steroidobacter gossypii]MBM0106230.1 Gfo/Idh/MocA family oxidoreductase [Steroidobacter gossypii]